MVDHYKVLGATKVDTPDEIKKKYRTLSKKYHPDRPDGDEAKFKEISEAYEVLSDPTKKRQWEFQNHRQSFQQQTSFNHFFKRQTFTTPNPDIRYTITISIEEFYTGTSKRFKIKRHRFKPEAPNHIYLEEKILEVNITKGVPNGHSIVVNGEGNHYPGKRQGNIIITLKELNRTQFIRKGQNLYYPVTISLKRALCGFQLSLTHLDGRKLEVNIEDIIYPDRKHIIAGEGMPPGINGMKGDLIIQFKIEFPDKLSKEVQTTLFTLL